MPLPVAAPPTGWGPVPTYERPPALLADAIDPGTGRTLSLIRAPHPVDAAVQFLARARRGSGPSVQVGHRFDLIDQASASAQRSAEAETRTMLEPLTRARHIELTSQTILVEERSNSGAAVLVYRNLRRGDPEARKVFP